MASINRVANGWRARWRTPDGHSRSKTFSRKLDAERHLLFVGNAMLTGSYVDPGAGKVTFKRYAEQWRVRQPHRPLTAKAVELNLRNHAYPAFGDRPIGAIRTSEIQAWVTTMCKTLAPSTVREILSKVRAVFHAAVLDRVVVVSPCNHVKVPKVGKPTVTPMAFEEVSAIADHMSGRLRAFVIVGAGTGLRMGELLGLTVDRVDFLRRAIRVDRQIVTVPGQRPGLAATKTEASVRTIPAAPAVLNALSAHLAAFPPGPGGFIFTASNGEPLTASQIRNAWRVACRAAGVKGFTPHDLRHFAASVLIDQGQSVKAVQQFLGHAKAAMTLDTYSHLWPSSDDQIRSALDRVLNPAVSQVCHDGLGQASDLH